MAIKDIDKFIQLFPNTPNTLLCELFEVSGATISREASRLNLTKNESYKSSVQSANAAKRKLTDAEKTHLSSIRKGVKLSVATIEKIRQTKIVNNSVPSGSNHYKWKGGKAWDRYKDPEYLRWRKMVLSRDNSICQFCGIQNVKFISAHHIKSYKEYPSLRFELSNGITLCRECHRHLHSKPLPAVEIIQCACGCGTTINSFDKYGRARRYVNFHGKRKKPVNS